MTTKRRILVVSERPSDFSEMARVAAELGRRGHVIIFRYYCQSLDSKRDSAVFDKIEQMIEGRLVANAILVSMQELCSIRQPAPRPTPVTRHQLNASWTGPIGRTLRLWARPIGRILRFPNPGFGLIRDLVRHSRLARHIATNIRVIDYYLRHYRLSVQALEEFEIDVIILPEDIVGMISPGLIKAGHKRGIPSLIFPYTIANQEEAFQSLRTREDYQTRTNWLAARLFPRWRMKADGCDLVRLPSSHIYAHELMRVTPPDPWLMNSGYANAVAVENKAMLDYNRRSGIPESKLRLIGTASDDMLYAHFSSKEGRRVRLHEELGLDSGLPMLLIGGCPNQLMSKVPHCDFKSMAEIVDFLADCLAPLRDQYQVIVRPHPNYLELGYMFEDRGHVSTMIDTAHLVPLADMFVAFASATIRWAIACRVPTINYDVFHYGYSDFTQVGGVVNVSKKADFRDALTKLAPNSPAYCEAREAIAHESEYWGMMDGKCVERMEAFIEEFCSMPVVPRTTA